MNLIHRRLAGITTAIVTAGLVVASPESPGVAAPYTPASAATPKSVLIHVDDDAAAGGDGSARRPFINIAEAIAAARTSPGPIVIVVRPGDYPQATSLVVDIPLELRGSTTQVINPDDPWPTGIVNPGTQTRILGTSALGSQPLISVARADGQVLAGGVTIADFVMETTATTRHMSLMRVQGYRVSGNIFRSPGRAFESVASSGQFTGNYMKGNAQGAVYGGGYPESPASVVVAGNRALNTTVGAIVISGSSLEDPVLGADRLDAVVRNNDLSGSTGIQGFGIRLGAPGLIAPGQSSAHVRADIRDNRMVGNRVGLQVDAGFPYRSVAGVCDPRTFSGTIDANLRGNVIADSLDTAALITFTRANAARTPSMLPLWQYLHGATFEISDPDGTLQDAWIDHPADDPFVGPCPNDQVHEPLGNTLRYNGLELSNGRNF